MAERLNVNTQIRTMYSSGMSYLSIKFFNTNLSFQFVPFVSKNQMGRDVYDSKQALMTTIDWNNAFALYYVSKQIIDGKINGATVINIPCAADASLTLERRVMPPTNNRFETVFSINKNNTVISFKFPTQQIQMSDANGQQSITIIESGLGAFTKTIEGYLTGINSDRHLDKLTEEYAKQQEAKSDQKNSYQPNQYTSNKPWKKNNNYNNNKNYNNNSQQQIPPVQSWENSPQQNMSSYQIS